MTTDLIIFIAFLGANLVLGLLAGSKVKTLREYAIGNKDFSTGAVTSTIIATWIGGGFMFNILQNIYNYGLSFLIIALLGASCCLLFIGQVLANRMGEFLNNLSIAEAMKDLYGKAAQIITALSGITLAIGRIAIQFKVIGKMITLLLAVEGPWVTIIAAGIVILYSSFGGLRSVTITDIFQSITFAVFVPILALIIWNSFDHPGQITDFITTSPLFQWKQVIGWNIKTLSMVGLLIFYMTPSIEPDIFQRIAMAKDLKQVRDSFTYAAAIRTLIVLVVAWIAILLLADPATKDPSSLLNYIISNYTYPGLKGLIAVGVVAMAMSTADSEINATAVLMVNDLLPHLKFTDPSTKKSLTNVRVTALITGALGLLLALYMEDLFKILLFSNSFYMPIVAVPFILAIFGFRSKARSMLIGMAAGFVTVVVWSILGDNGDSIIPGMLANITFFMGSHYLLKEEGGWIGVGDKQPLILARQRRQAAWRKLKYNLTTPQIFESLKKALPTNDSVYALFAVYVIGATYVAFFTVPKDVTNAYQGLYDGITVSTLFATAAFLTCPAWPTRFRPQGLMAFAWPIGISYLLFVVGGILVVMSGFNQVQVMIFMMNLIIAALLLPWQLVVLLCAGSLLVVSIVLNAWEVAVVIPVGAVAASMEFKIFYIILLFSGSLLAIIKFRQQNNKLQQQYITVSTQLGETSKDLVKALTAEYRIVKALDVEGVKALEETAMQAEHILNTLSRVIPEGVQEQIIAFKERTLTTANYLSQVVHRATAYMRLDVDKIYLHELVSEVQATLATMGLPVVPQVSVVMGDDVDGVKLQDLRLKVDIFQIKQLLCHAIIYAQSKLHEPQQVIWLRFDNTLLDYPLNSVQGRVKHMSALRIMVSTQSEFPPVEKSYLNNMEESVIDGIEDQYNIHLVQSQRILQAHYGFMALEIKETQVTQVYVIPQNVRAVRPREMEIPELNPTTRLQLSDENYPGAQEQEEAFLAALPPISLAELGTVHQAIRFIKRLHGPVKRKSGEPFYLHPIAAAQIVMTYTKDLATILATLLHDVVEDTAVTLAQVELMFGRDVRKIVDGVTHMDSLAKMVYRLQLGEYENWIQLIKVDDTRTLHAKLADRLHNMRTIEGHSKIEKQKQIATETLAFFVPVAKWLGLTEVAEELQRRSTEVLDK